MTSQRGRCLCGTIAYETSTPPARVTYCHCRFCQRGTGSAYLVEPIFDRSAFEIVSGEPRIYDHRSEGSGKLVHVHFCDRCGTKLMLTFERFPDVVGIFGGTFDDPNWFDRSPANSKHIFLDVAQNGTVVPAGIDTYGEHATTSDGEPIAPKVFDTHHLFDGS